MSRSRTGSGSPATTLALLWRDPAAEGSRRGPRPGLTVDRIVQEAIEIADSGGMQAVTMRRVAEATGVTPMSLYTYVPGKNELLDLMLDTVFAQMRRTDLAGEPWRARVEAVARENRELYERHPWAATVSTTRPPLGPGQLAKYEHELRAFDDTGLDDIDRDAALTYVLSFVQASAWAAAEAARIEEETAMTDEEWWASNAPLLERVLDPDRYPTAARVGTAAGAAHRGTSDPAHAFEFGLQRVLDGLERLVTASGTR